MTEENERSISPVVTHLMRGVVYRREKQEIWESLIRLQSQVRDYVTVMGLDVQIFEGDGYAYLSTREPAEGDTPLPRLISRRALSYPVSLVLVLLRRKLTEMDNRTGESRLILDTEEIADLVSTFFAVGSNQVKFRKRIDGYLQRIHELGFIRFLGDGKNRIEVKPILKAFIDAQWLSEFNAKLEAYREYGEFDAGGEDES